MLVKFLVLKLYRPEKFDDFDDKKEKKSDKDMDAHGRRLSK